MATGLLFNGCMRHCLLSLCLLVVGCGGGADATSTPGASPSPSPTESDPSGIVEYEDGCAPVSLASTLTSTTLSFSERYPASWNDSTTQTDMPTLASWAMTQAPPADGAGLVRANRFYSGNDQADPIADIKGSAGDGMSAWNEFTLGGHRAASWWSRQAAPQPGCPSPCGEGPPPPDDITIGIGIAMGGREILVVSGRASVTSKAQLFCEIQAIVASVTPTK
jgi:hypothetical protein